MPFLWPLESAVSLGTAGRLLSEAVLCFGVACCKGADALWLRERLLGGEGRSGCIFLGNTLPNSSLVPPYPSGRVE